MQAETIHCQCASSKRSKINSNLSFLGALLITILPKCPFCIMAYSTAITVCSAKVVSPSAHWPSYISISLALLTLMIVLFNFKGRRTLISSLIIILGAILISYSELLSGSPSLYYLGGIILLAGVWANGSFLFFFNFFKAKVWGHRVRIHG